jgi:ribosomal protein S18 acetylase RimI-like enzyme
MHITDYAPDDALPLVRMWRASFEHGVGVADPHPIEGQIAYLHQVVLPANRVRLARIDNQIVGFLAASAESVAQLYVRVDHIGQGIGSQLLALAQAESAGSLWLYTFARNARARRFYESRGFVAIAHGFEPMWQLDDVKYRWQRAAQPAIATTPTPGAPP